MEALLWVGLTLVAVAFFAATPLKELLGIGGSLSFLAFNIYGKEGDSPWIWVWVAFSLLYAVRLGWLSASYDDTSSRGRR